MDGIFISYRRDDSAGYAGRLYDRLSTHFGAARVFMDVEGIEPGVDFVAAIESAVSSCRVLIVIIGNEWTQAKDATGRRRLDDPHDFVRLETGAALQRGIRVVPVLVEGAGMPHVDDLPDDLKPLARRQAIEISHKQWEASTGELIRTLEGLLAGTPGAITGATTDAAAEPEVIAHDRATGAQGSRVAAAAALLLVALAAGGWWLARNQREETPMPPTPSTPVATLPAPDTRTAAPVTQVPASAAAPAVPAAASPPPPAVRDTSEKRPAAPQEQAAVPSTPASKTVAPEPSPTPVATVAPTPATPPPPAVTAPTIRSFTADRGSDGTRLCYRVSNADSLTLTPYSGQLANHDDCVTVDVERPTKFTLTARSGSKGVQKTLLVAPRPVAQPVPAPIAQEAAAATTREAKPEPAANPAYPVKGERWTYRSSGKWPTSPKRVFEITVQSMADGVVTEALRIVEPASSSAEQLRRTRGSQPGFVASAQIGLEFNPYFAAFVDLAQQDSWSGFSTPDLEPSWPQWNSRVKLLGQESVRVSAGTFNAYKMEVWSVRHPTGGQAQRDVEPVQVRYEIWYAPSARRYVKMQRIVTSAAYIESENDVFELLAHQTP